MNALVLQCGGPTPVVNTTLAALVRRWRELARPGTLMGGRYGLAGLTSGDWLALPDQDDAWLSSIERSAGMALGGGRSRLDDNEARRALAELPSRGVDTLFLIGGNGTMAAGRALAAHARMASIPLRVIGVPKTVDNDIPGTDLCPGFPSAARFLIDAVRDLWADVSSMRGYEDVVLIEVMGRHAGWLAASTMLARSRAADAPHLVLVPEQPLADASFLEDVREFHTRCGVCFVVVAEGVRGGDGALLTMKSAGGAVERDASGQIILGRSGGPLPYLASLVRTHLGLRCRSIRPDVLQRCSRAHVAPLDSRIAALVGAAAVERALTTGPQTAAMIALRGHADTWRTEAVPLDAIRGARTLSASVDSELAKLRPILA